MVIHVRHSGGSGYDGSSAEGEGEMPFRGSAHKEVCGVGKSNPAEIKVFWSR